MLDGLYINEVWVSPASELRLNLQANDLREPATLQTSYSSAFNLPDSLTVRRVTEGAESTTSDSRIPFTLIPARLVQAGINVFDGYARFLEYNARDGWQVNLVDKNKALYSRLDRKLSTLDLSEYAFRWNAETITAAAGNREGVCFPLVDYGAFENGGQAMDLLLPAAFVKTLLKTMTREEGYELDWPTAQPYADFLDALVLPVAAAKPKKTDAPDSFVADRQARAGLGQGPGMFTGSRQSNFSVPVPFALIDLPSKGYSQGRLGNFKAGTFSYVADTSMRLAYKLDVSFRLKVMSGGVDVTLQLQKNGTTIKEQTINATGPHNVMLSNYESFNWSGHVDMVAGDTLTLQLAARRYTWLGAWEFALDDQGSSWTLAPDLTVLFGDTFQLASGLPDLTCLELLKSVALACCGTYQINDIDRTLRFIPLTPLVADRAGAVDWSDRIDEDGECRYVPSIEPYGQTNTLAYKQKDDKTTDGNGTIVISASALEEKVDLFELPFGPVPVSKLSVGTLNVMPRIEIRKIERATDGSVTVTDQEPENGPHWLLIHPTKTEQVKTMVGTTNPQAVNVPLRPCWFDTRPDVVKGDGTRSMTLSFDDPSVGEQGLISLFFGGLQKVLERPRTLELSRLLTPTELSVLRLDKLVYIGRQSIGGLSMPPTYYYVAQVSDYEENVPSQITLIAAS